MGDILSHNSFNSFALNSSKFLRVGGSYSSSRKTSYASENMSRLRRKNRNLTILVISLARKTVVARENDHKQFDSLVENLKSEMLKLHYISLYNLMLFHRGCFMSLFSD
tara:strand:- start:310 stop:636 length:327 start_codon:yes stop_codon:yes gene_type:complete